VNYSPTLLKILGTNMSEKIVNVKYPEQRLFQAIIVQAFEDCVFKTYSKVDAYNKEDSYNWFKDGGEDFDRVCWFADMDPSFVRDRFLKLKKEGVIKFSKSELTWMEYRNRYKRYRAANDKESRRIIKRQIDRLTLPGKKEK
jgi:hypothetical protein